MPTPGEADEIVLGQWYWVKGDEDDDENGRGEWLACVTKVGSNYARLTSPFGGSCRVHIDEFDEQCRREPRPEQIIAANVDRCRLAVRRNIERVQEITARLGVAQRLGIAGPHEEASETTRAMSTVSGQADPAKYKQDLILARDEQLPAIFKQIKAANEELSHWMTADTLALKAEADHVQVVVGVINDRVFNVGLYAGLTEEAEQVRRGEPASVGEKLHLMQRMCYMDEECIAGYRAGGIDFDSIGKFDRWLSRQENLDRILPFRRTAVAFRVRRNMKHREWDGTLQSLFVNIRLGEADKLTFLYVRNGAQLWRIQTDIAFGAKLFPDETEFDLSEATWAKMHCGKVDELITDREYQVLKAERAEERQAWDAWVAEHPDEHTIHCPHGMWRPEDFGRRYERFDSSSVYFDDISADLQQRIDHYNRICLILQGLFDRSQVLHPHPPARLWTPDGFGTLVKLVRDKDRALHYGEPPSFEEYRARCNESLTVGSVTVGQEDFWLRREAERENRRRDNDWRVQSRHYHHTRFCPAGDPGPGLLAKVAQWQPRAKKACYRWLRESRDWREYTDKKIKATVTVPAAELFHVDAYQPGDFRQFYADPRTRATYLQWAVFLLAAEEYLAGNLQVGEHAE